MRKILAILTIIAMAMVVNVPGASAWFFEIENPDKDAIFELYFEPEAATVLLENYALNFGYDDAVDKLVYLSYTNTPPTGLSPDFFGDLVDQGGWLQNFNASTFGTGASVSTRILLGTFTFDISQSLIDGNDDMWFLTADPMPGATIDNVYYSQKDNPSYFVNGAGLDVPVPIPGAVLLLGSGLLGLIGIGRRRLAA